MSNFTFLRLCPKLVGRTGRKELPTQAQNKHIQTPMPLVGFEPMTPAFERTPVHALERAATVFGTQLLYSVVNKPIYSHL
jgi:hypothetical protein